MKVRFYIAPQTIHTDSAGEYWASILNDLIDITQDESFDEIDNPARKISICCVHALDATHANIAADSRVIVASPLANDIADMKTKLETLFNSISGVATLKTKLEAIGINTAWISGSNTLRDGLRYLIRIFTTAQILNGEGNTDVRDFIANNLDTTVVEVPVAVRNKVKAWMQNKGLAIGWITNSTTVREILHFIVENLGIGKLKMSGEDF